MDGIWMIDAAKECRPEYVKGSSYLPPRGEREGLRTAEDGQASVQGFVHRIRPMGGVVFVVVRTGRALIQCVWDGELPDGLCEGACVDARGVVVEDARALERLLPGIVFKGKSRRDTSLVLLIVFKGCYDW